MNIGKAVAVVAMGAGALFQASCMTGGQLTEGTELRPYPYGAEIRHSVDVQVFRDGSHIELVSHTTESLDDFDLWLNERYLRHIESLPPGASLKLSLYEFLDEYGEPFRAGGIWSTNLPEPVVKAEVETTDGLVGLISIPERER